MKKQFPASELILRPDGAVYHLNLKPEELADTIITVGDPDRVKWVSKHFDKIEIKKQHREFVTHTGYVGKKRISVISTGIGTDNIDIVMNELDALANIDLQNRTVKAKTKKLKIIRIGTSGSMQALLPVDTVVASAHAIGLDMLAHYYLKNYSRPEDDMMQQIWDEIRVPSYIASADKNLLKAFSKISELGTTVTCSGFYAAQGRVLRYKLRYPNMLDQLSKMNYQKTMVTNFEMETAGIYVMGKILGHECLSISLLVANRITKTFSPDADSQMKLLIKNCLAVIEKL